MNDPADIALEAWQAAGRPGLLAGENWPQPTMETLERRTAVARLLGRPAADLPGFGVARAHAEAGVWAPLALGDPAGTVVVTTPVEPGYPLAHEAPPIDVLALDPADPRRRWRLTGLSAALGEDALMMAARGDADTSATDMMAREIAHPGRLRIIEQPIDFLRGWPWPPETPTVCVLDWGESTLRDAVESCAELVADSAAHASRVHKATRKPRILPKVLIAPKAPAKPEAA